MTTDTADNTDAMPTAAPAGDTIATLLVRGWAPPMPSIWRASGLP